MYELGLNMVEPRVGRRTVEMEHEREVVNVWFGRVWDAQKADVS